jgi:hypothetical protein
MKPLSVKGFEHYLVDEFGNVYNTINSRRNKLLNPKRIKSWSNKNTGYSQVVLRNTLKGIKAKALYVHRLVAEAYIPNPNNLPQVNHINGVKNDNRVSNLEWVNASQNQNHRVNLFGTLCDRIVQNKKLLNAGVDLYFETKNTKRVSQLWKCSNITTYKILKKLGIDTSSRFDTPDWILGKLKNDLLPYLDKRFPTGFKKQIIEKYKKLYNVDLTHHKIVLIKKILIRNDVSQKI